MTNEEMGKIFYFNFLKRRMDFLLQKKDITPEEKEELEGIKLALRSKK